MDLYTLNENFLAKDVVDDFVSAVWTERYSAAGDVSLVVSDTADMREKLAEGTYLARRGSKEIMLLETQSIEDNMMTVVGQSLLGFLNERLSWFTNPDTTSTDRIADYTDIEVPGQIIADVVSQMVIAHTPFTQADDETNLKLDWARDIIPNLSLGSIDTSGVAERITIPVGPLYDAIQTAAEKYAVGISLYLESADPVTGYTLKFTTYRGQDRTSDQSVNPLIRLTPALDSLNDIKELNSISGYKNVAYVYYQKYAFDYKEITIHYADPDAPIPEGFARRVLLVDPTTQPPGHKITKYQGTQYEYSYIDPAISETDMAAFKAQTAKDALANHNYIRAMDGQTSPENDYKFGVDYGLGDVIELQSLTGTISKARVTEYIRSEDKNGEREFPTISVIS